MKLTKTAVDRGNVAECCEPRPMSGRRVHDMCIGRQPPPPGLQPLARGEPAKQSAFPAHHPTAFPTMAQLKEITVEANLGTSQNGLPARASLSPEGLRIIIAENDSVKEIMLDSPEQIAALAKIFQTHSYASINFNVAS
jgi:hypothetical protein